MHSEAFPSRLFELVFRFRGLAAALSSRRAAAQGGLRQDVWSGASGTRSTATAVLRWH